ncbi:hypothetical protein VT84_12425 [Gemmata sp. SH-PL17]|nr:hypothetical protein VT84_12425 [Gemmata sp. SH-PL17]
MIWLNLTLVAARLRSLFHLSPSPSFSQQVMERYMRQIEKNPHVAFGCIRPGSADRLSRRLQHAEALIGQLLKSGVDCFWPIALRIKIKDAFDHQRARQPPTGEPARCRAAPT